MYRIVFLFCLVTSVLNAQEIRPTKITVAKDSSGDYQTIQQAVNACRDLGQALVTIYIKNGIYKEKLVIPSEKTALRFIGESRDSTIITHDDYSGKPIPPGMEIPGKEKYGTFTSYT